MDLISYQTLTVKINASVCFIKFNRPAHDNAINRQLIDEFHQALDRCNEKIKIVVIEGSSTTFCIGMDFNEISEKFSQHEYFANDAEPLFDLWSRLSQGDFISICHVEGRVNAGGMGFIAASDIVIAHPRAQFSLSELLFGLIPACVLPFLNQKIGSNRANYMTMATWPFPAKEMADWGLVNVIDENSLRQLRKHIARLSRINKSTISELKGFSKNISRQDNSTEKKMALKTNHTVFSDQNNLNGIKRYIQHGLFPWEEDTAENNPKSIESKG